MKKCKQKDCNLSSQAKGYCDKHYRRFKKYGDASKKYVFEPKECLAEGCGRRSVSKQYCDKHYRRLIKYGTVELIKEKRSCSIESCERKHVAKNLCAMHYEMKTQKIKIDSDSQKIIDSHNGMCDICKSEVAGFGRKRLCIDHDHETGKFRGMLCQKCNIGLGNFNDNVSLLEQAIRYLKR